MAAITRGKVRHRVASEADLEALSATYECT
jgi:hypothetical protein